MMRFIDLRNQGTYHRFTFWDTVVSDFVRFCGDSAWDSEDDLVQSIHLEHDKDPKRAADITKRLTGLMPDWAKVDDGKGEEEWEK